MKEKVIRVMDPREIIYSKEQKEVFLKKRSRAYDIMDLLGPSSILYGSLARGDVHTESDIDIVFLIPVETYIIELPLLENGYRIVERELIQANPNSIPKAHIHLEDNTILTIPLYRPSRNEEEFYRFGGAVDIEDIRKEKRVRGVTKKLLFIEPTDKGHIEYSIKGREVDVSRKLNLNIDTVRERIRVLSRRDAIGRTGVYLKEQLKPDESFESVWKYLTDRDPVLRRQSRIRKK